MIALKSKNPGLAPFGLLIQDSLTLSSGFSKLSSHTKREGNIVANNLAQLAVNFFSNCVIWIEDVSSDVLSSYHMLI